MKPDDRNEIGNRQIGTDTDIDRLIRWHLQDAVKDESPPDRVWEKIQASLDGGPVAHPARRRFPMHLPFAAQAMTVATLFLVLTGVIVSLNISSSWRHSQWAAFSSQPPIVMTREDTLSGRLAFINEQEWQHVQRSLSPAEDPVLQHRRWGG